MFGVKNFSLVCAFNIRGQRENTPYSSLEPNESDIVNRQSGDEKMKYVLKFHIWVHGTHEVWGRISRNPLKIVTWFQRSTNRKWHIVYRMVTWLMTSRDPERSRSWPQYIWGPLSRQRLEIQTWFQWTTNRKWPPGNQMVTWLMTSRDPERPKSWPHYA